MAPLQPRVLVPVPIKQRIPNLPLHRTLLRSLILGLVASILLRPRSRLHSGPLNSGCPIHRGSIAMGGSRHRSRSRLHAALWIDLRRKQKVPRVRRPDRPIRISTHRRQRPPHSNRAGRLIPGRNRDPAHRIVLGRRARVRHKLPIRREPPKALSRVERHLPFATVFLFVIPQRSGGICFCTDTTPQRHHPQMVHLVVLLQRHVRHREHHPLATRRDLWIAHPLHRHQIRKRHRSLGRDRLRSLRCRLAARLPSTLSQPRHHPGPRQYNPNRTHLLHRASLHPTAALSHPAAAIEAAKKSLKNPSNSACQASRSSKIPLTNAPSITYPRKIVGIVAMLQRV